MSGFQRDDSKMTVERKLSEQHKPMDKHQRNGTVDREHFENLYDHTHLGRKISLGDGRVFSISEGAPHPVSLENGGRRISQYRIDMNHEPKNKYGGLHEGEPGARDYVSGTKKYYIEEEEIVEVNQGPCSISGKSYPWKLGCVPWCRKYFWDKPSASTWDDTGNDLYISELQKPSKLLTDYRRIVALVVPAMIVHFCWWSIMIKHNLWYLFADRYILAITMVFASFLAGLTSIGGGAIAFPVLTLLLHVPPEMARDFGLLIQSFGMTSATFTIMFMGVQVEWHAIIYGTLGGAFGLIIGLELIEMHMTPSLKKMVFASFWFSFAFALFLLNRYRKRRTFPTIMIFTWWKAILLVVTGIVGGIFTSFVGSGLDICSLSVLTLFFRVSEKQATPTSVILMAVNSVLGLFWRQAIQNTVDNETWKYVAVCAFVVVIGAPIGSVVGTRLHRLVLACIIYMIVGVTLIISFVLVPQTPILVGISVAVIIVGGFVFCALTLSGSKLLEREIIVSEIMRQQDLGFHSTTLEVHAGNHVEHNVGEDKGEEEKENGEAEPKIDWKESQVNDEETGWMGIKRIEKENVQKNGGGMRVKRKSGIEMIKFKLDREETLSEEHTVVGENNESCVFDEKGNGEI